MVWFSEDLLNPDMIFEQFLVQLRNTAINEDEKQHKVMAGDQQQQAKSSSPNMQVGQYTSFDKADGLHLSDFDATSHI